MRATLTSDPVEELARLDWRSDADVVRADGAIAHVEAQRAAAVEELTRLRAQAAKERNPVTSEDQAAVSKLLGRAISAIGISQGPSTETRQAAAEATIAAADRQLKILNAERHHAVVSAKRQIAEAFEKVSGPILRELIATTERGVELNDRLIRLRAIGSGQFEAEMMGAWPFLPEGSPEPAAHLSYSGYEGRLYAPWRYILQKQGYVK